MNNEKSLNDNQKSKAQEEFDTSRTHLNSISDSISGDKNHKEMDSLYEKIKNKDNTSDELKRFNELKKEDQERKPGDTFADKIEKRSLAKKDLGAKKATLENYTKKEENINKALEKLSGNTTDSAS